MSTHSRHHPIRHIAIIGISEKPDRPSYQVASYLLDQGFTIIPINPHIPNWKGIATYPSLSTVPKTVQIDTVDIFRNPDYVLEIVTQAIARGGIYTIWMQEGSYNDEAYRLAQKAGIQVVAHMCMMVAHKHNSLSSLTDQAGPKE